MDRSQLDKILDDLRETVNNATTESDVQRYLEKYPFLVCGFAGHVDKGIVISQFPLGADFSADFAFVSSNSKSTLLHLIEIENPKLQMFLANGEFSQPYNHAYQQIQDWASWCKRNQAYLQDILEPLDVTTKYVETRCKLIAGRRSELTNQKRIRRYSAKDEQLPKGFEITTYDGFMNEVPVQQFLGYHLDDIKCVTYKDQDYFEKAVNSVLVGP